MRPSYELFATIGLLLSGCAAHVDQTPFGIDHRPYQAKPGYLTAAPDPAKLRSMGKLLRRLPPGSYGGPLQTESGGGSLVVEVPDSPQPVNRADDSAPVWEAKVLAAPLDTPPNTQPVQPLPSANPEPAAQ